MPVCRTGAFPLGEGTKRGFYWIYTAGNGTPHLCLNNRPRAVLSVSDRRTIRTTVASVMLESVYTGAST